jgi:hypothetical protein
MNPAKFLAIFSVLACACVLEPSPESDPVIFHRPRPVSGPSKTFGVVSTGQSLSVGGRAGDIVYPPVYAGPSARGEMLVGLTGPSSGWSLAPLSEPMRGGSTSEWPSNVGWQSPTTPMADRIYSRVRAKTAHAVVGQNGQGMDGIKKGGSVPSYTGSIQEMTKFRDLYATAGEAFEISAVVLTHGETDYGSATYGADLLQMWADYNADLKALTGQTRDVKLFLTQPSAGWPIPAGEASNIPDVMLATYLAHPDKFVLVGAKTHLSYWVGDFHLDAAGTRDLGFMYGEAVGDYIRRRADFVPLYPTATALGAGFVEVAYNRPIVRDASLYGSTHTVEHAGWRLGEGFELRAGAAEIPITGVTWGINNVQIAYSGATAPDVVSYTLFGDGAGTIRRGCVRDAAGRWSVQFSHAL